MINKMRYIEMFGGIGGFSYGIKKGGGGECVGYYEIDKYAIQTYNKNFGTDWKPTDIKQVPAESIPDHDVLCAGFPCQSFSIAGKRKGFVDTRGTLFFEICRVAQAKRPKILFLENVKGLLNHDEGRTFATILESLQQLGYFVEWQVLNSKHYGVPQNRERVFIIGHLGGEPRQKVFPIGENKTKANDLCGQQTNTLKSRYTADGDGSYIIESKFNAQGGEKWLNQQKSSIGCVQNAGTPVIPTKKEENVVMGTVTQAFGRRGHSKEELAMYHKIMVHNLQPRSEFRPSLLKDKNAGGYGHLSKDDGTTYCLDGANTQAIEIGTWRTHNEDKGFRPIKDGISPSIAARAREDGSGQPVIKIQENNIRRLTPTECERLQGFPDGWTEGVSDTQRYKQLGNAVTTNVIEVITHRLNELHIHS